MVTRHVALRPSLRRRAAGKRRVHHRATEITESTESELGLGRRSNAPFDGPFALSAMSRPRRFLAARATLRSTPKNLSHSTLFLGHSASP